MTSTRPKVVPDEAHPGMWRVRWPDGRVSDMTNLTRAKDAVTFFIETEERRQRGRSRGGTFEAAVILKIEIEHKGRQP